MVKRVCIWIAWAVAFEGAAAADGGRLNEARSALEQWVQTRQLVAKTRADWVAEKDVFAASVLMFERELTDLDAKVAGLGEASEQVGRERTELQLEKAALGEASDRAKEVATIHEKRVKAMSRSLPEPLARRIQPLIDRFPDEPESTRLTAAEGLQTLVGVLNEIDKFNSSVAIESEIRTNAEGREVQVETIYLGLAQAYFVGEGGKFAGVAVPTAEGWQSTAQNELGPVIARAIAMYRNQVPAALVVVPFELK
jgi:soluble cytochrome b562